MPWDFWLIFLALGVLLPWRGRVRMKKLLAMPRVSLMERLVLYASTIAFQWLAVAVVSWRVWDPTRLRYGNYIDAMAMIRRDAIINVGGYSLDDRLQLGWEDFDLWCSFADRGWHGVQIPEILCRYRTGVYSMLAVTDIDAQAAWSALVERHPFLTSTHAAAA